MVPGPITFDLVSLDVDPNSRPASGYQQPGAFEAAIIECNPLDVVDVLHPFVGRLLVLLVRVTDAVRNVLAPPAKVLFARLTFLL